MKKPVIAFDHDDVLFDFFTPLCTYRDLVHGTKSKREEMTDYDLSKVWNCSGAEVGRIVADFYHSPHHAEIMPLEGAIDGIRQLAEKYELHIVTARPDSLEEMTMKRLSEFFPGMFTGIHFTNHFHGSDKKRMKSEVCKILGAELLVEDAIHNAVDVASVGIPVILFDTPWNKEFSGENIIRAASWREVVERVKQILG